MDVTEEYMTPTEMLEKITELDYAQSQQRDLNAKMRQLLDVADDDIAVLRSENANLRKQVKALEKNISEAQKVEAEPCSSLLADDINAKRCSEQKIQKLEKEYTTIKEQNKKLTTELKSLQQERDQDKIGLSRFKVSLQTLERSMGEAQLELLKRDEVIHQKNLQLKHSEEAMEECSNIIKDLRLTNHKLSEQLENRLDEASFAFVNDLMVEKEGSLSPPLSFAEEMNLLASSAEVEINMSDSADLRHEESEAEEPPKPQSVTVDLQTKRCAGVLETAVQRARLFLLFVVLTVSAFVASGSCTGNFFSINTLWSGAHLMLQPYCSVQYGALPPI
ncbi:golgin subfamily A member 6B-like isoform X1 [Perca flavescens]|uniref:golgin subfamily A member 6B-like isoform X1 n=1 Tax=Perca flavescens TaxID=8167 RepID=UPI00106E6B3F|nr:golgin subfamily A member 6B-like isoform X1 [Perca flavescens]XP_028445827.1 golgin subfamily A member 6B-like isoform X1 [Perca flavescens]